VAAVGVGSSERDREIERAMRAHPAGRALRGGEVATRSAPVRPAAVRAVPSGRAPTGVPAGAPPAPRLRLTARGRLVVAVLALAGTTGVAAVTGLLPGSAPGAALHLEGQSSVVVRSGDTLWSIAASVAGEDDVRDVVDRIQRVNGLSGTTLVPGEVLRLP
jgi:nucleoid-associated protein YgaU